MAVQPGGANGSDRRRRTTPLTPEKIRTVDFPRAPFGRRGYLEEDVRRFLSRVAEDVSAANTEKAYLRAEVERLRNWYRDANVDVDSQLPPHVPSTQAVSLMSQAQQAADRQVAQAEDYARQVLTEARQQYREILREARRKAGDGSGLNGGEERANLERRIAWLRTYAQVTQIQLRSTLEALTRELDKLGELPTPADQEIG